MKRTALALVVLLVAGCSSLPPAPIAVGDTCTRCSRTIRNTRLATEIVDSGGLAWKFRTAECMAKYIAQRKPDAAVIYVTDYASGRLVKASAVSFVPSMLVVDGKDKTREYVAYYNSKSAQDAAAREKTTPIDWDQLLELARTTGS
jgi:hypothetical protein